MRGNLKHKGDLVFDLGGTFRGGNVVWSNAPCQTEAVLSLAVPLFVGKRRNTQADVSSRLEVSAAAAALSRFVIDGQTPGTEGGGVWEGGGEIKL